MDVAVHEVAQPERCIGKLEKQRQRHILAASDRLPTPGLIVLSSRQQPPRNSHCGGQGDQNAGNSRPNGGVQEACGGYH